MSNRWLNIFAIGLAGGAAALLAYGNYDHDQSQRLPNVSYDPTRELYAELNPKFLRNYRAATGRSLQIELSHGGSSKQARAVSDGPAADVVTLALPLDIEGLVRERLVDKSQRQRLPHDARPYTSTVVFVVRKTNPKQSKADGKSIVAVVGKVPAALPIFHIAQIHRAETVSCIL